MQPAGNPLAPLLARIEIRRWPWKISLRPTAPGSSELMQITERVPDRDTAEMTTLGALAYGHPADLDEATLTSWVYRQLQRHVLHELAEAFHVDGKRVFDPHAGEWTAEEMNMLLEQTPTMDGWAEVVDDDAQREIAKKLPRRGDYLTSAEIERFAKRR